MEFGYSSYNLNIGPIICSLYSGTKFTYKIISFIDKILSVTLLFDGEIDEDSKKLIPYFSIKNKIPSSEPINLYFTVPDESFSSKNNKYKLKGHLEIKIEESEIEPLLIEFSFNVILLPLEIYLISNNGDLFWDENKFSMNKNNFKENDIFGFRYFIRNFYENYSSFNKNISLKSLGKNEVDNKPIIRQDNIEKNNFNIELPKIFKKQELFEGLLKIYFNNKIYIPIELNGKIKKPDFKVFYFDPVCDQIEENLAHIYI